MKTQVKVYAKAQNRLALGIIKAFYALNPQSKLGDLKKAFPDGLNPDCGSKQIFMSEKEIKKHIDSGEEWYASARGYFVGDDEWLVMSNGERVGVVSMWSKPSIDRLIEQAKKYGIEAVESDEKRGTYRLEYLNGVKSAKGDTPTHGDEVAEFINEMQSLMEEYNIDYVPIMEGNRSDDDWTDDDDGSDLYLVACYDDMLDITYGDSVDEVLDDDGREKMNELFKRIPEKIFPTIEELNETKAKWDGFVLLITCDGLEYEER